MSMMRPKARCACTEIRRGASDSSSSVLVRSPWARPPFTSSRIRGSFLIPAADVASDALNSYIRRRIHFRKRLSSCLDIPLKPSVSMTGLVASSVQDRDEVLLVDLIRCLSHGHQCHCSGLVLVVSSLFEVVLQRLHAGGAVLVDVLEDPGPPGPVKVRIGVLVLSMLVPAHFHHLLFSGLQV